MKLNRVLIVYKKSSFAIYAKERNDKRIKSLIEQKSPAVRFMVKGHKLHEQTLSDVQEIFRKRRIAFKLMYRAAYFNEEGWDMVLSVGGDGTFMEAAHRLKKVPLLGLNSNPAGSVGFFCGARLENLETMLDRVEDGSLKPTKLSRLELLQHRKPLGRTILNDCLIASSNPAATPRVSLSWGQNHVMAKSSGVWISTAAGSTGATRSAGGKVLPLSSAKFQMIIREPYLLPEDKKYPAHVLLAPDTSVHIMSNMREGAIYIDGAHHKIDFPLGDKVTLRPYVHPLYVLGYNTSRRKKLER